jgi:phage shock protein A
MGAFSRIRYVITANVNALLEKAEDPEKLLRALIREMEDAGEDARLAVADLLAEQEHLERLGSQLEREIVEWQERAEKAVATEREDLARAALKAKAEVADNLQATRDEHALLTDRIAQLESDMNTLKGKLAEAKLKLKDMLRRDTGGPSPARPEPRLSPGERKMREAMGRFDRLQSQVERLEARVRSYEVGGLAPSAWEASMEPADPAIEAELEALKARVAGEPASPEPRKRSQTDEQSERTEA